MELSLYRTPLFEKQLKALDKADKKGAQAAERAAEIIRQLSVDGWQWVAMMNKRTKRGELRVRKCLKYDLGSGYRLISLKRDSELFLLYVGTHDECDRWLNKKRGSKLQVEPESFIFVAENVETPSGQLADTPVEEMVAQDEYEEQLSAKLSDPVLRQVFRGICQR
ncbi:MAG: hypothetical protein KKC76_14530 [Proteobacteria bacterium]|nr:hypothetical protein [Pseudomonadota bacterium]MBU4297801.1 hypothetical protein [Pseudomonadota bacterium]MCG2748336.1 hypothetical protein [Desulfobulbaceae bacterium]